MRARKRGGKSGGRACSAGGGGLLCASLLELQVLDQSVLPTQVQIGALLLLLRLLWLPDLSERLQVCCVQLWPLCSAVFEC